MPDVDNFLTLTAQQRAAVIRMVSHVLDRPVHWPADEDWIVHEAIEFRRAHGLAVFPHLEVQLLDEEMEEEPPEAPGTPDIVE